MNDIFPFLPLGIIVFFAIALMLMEVMIEGRKQILAYVSLGGVILSALSTVSLWNKQEQPFKLSFFSDMFVVDNFSLFFYLIFLLSAGVTSLISPSYLKKENIEHGEYYSLMLFSVSGMMLMASAGDLLTLFLGLEIMSIAVYVMVGFKRYDLKSNEAILKYFFLGAFSAGFILYGIALLYGSCETTNLLEIRDAMRAENFNNTNLAMIGILLTLTGILFKVGAAPFHIWTPDVYDGAPAPVTGFMITAVKAASFAMFIKLFLISFSSMGDFWRDLIVFLAIITMFVGNILAFTQENIKRMLAYSSISHTGYLMIGIAALGLNDGNGDILNSFNISNDAANAILYYITAYTVSSLGIFACISYLSQK
jgi:NADH-quinone oxidoreductase subunit N